MRILMTTDTIGGVWNFTAGLCEFLCADHEVALVSFGRALSSDQAAWVHGMAGGSFQFTASEAPLEWMPDNELALEGSGLLTRIASEFQPNLLHADQFCWGALPRVGALDIPRVVTAHSDVLSWADACRPGGLPASLWLIRYVNLVQEGLNGADAVVAPTRWMLDSLRSTFTVAAEGSVVYNGVAAGPASSNQRKRQIVTAGRFWDEGKNLKLLQELTSPFPILCAGEGVPNGLGSLSHKDLQQFFLGSEIYLCPSLYEPFGLAPMEAAACGCALVLHDLPSLREIWGDAALYFTSKASLEALLAELWLHPEVARQAALRAMKRAAEFPLSRTADDYANVYRALVVSNCEKGQLAHA